MNHNIIWTGLDQLGNVYFTWDLNDKNKFDYNFYEDIIFTSDGKNYLANNKAFEIEEGIFFMLRTDLDEREYLWNCIVNLNKNYKNIRLTLNVSDPNEIFYYRLAAKFLRLKEFRVNQI